MVLDPTSTGGGGTGRAIEVSTDNRPSRGSASALACRDSIASAGIRKGGSSGPGNTTTAPPVSPAPAASSSGETRGRISHPSGTSNPGPGAWRSWPNGIPVNTSGAITSTPRSRTATRYPRRALAGQRAAERPQPASPLPGNQRRRHARGLRRRGLDAQWHDQRLGRVGRNPGGEAPSTRRPGPPRAAPDRRGASAAARDRRQSPRGGGANRNRRWGGSAWRHAARWMGWR